MVSLTTQELTSTGHFGWNSTKTQAYVLCASIVCALFMPKESQSYVPCRSIVCSLFVPAPRTGSGAGGRSAPPRGKPVVSHTTGFFRAEKKGPTNQSDWADLLRTRCPNTPPRQSDLLSPRRQQVLSAKHPFGTRRQQSVLPAVVLTHCPPVGKSAPPIAVATQMASSSFHYT